MFCKKIPRHSTILSNEEFKIILKLLLSKELIKGKNIKGFEDKFSKYIDVKHTISVSSARMGIYLALKSIGIERGDEIILPSYNFHIIPSIVLGLGVKPIFVDIDQETFNIDPQLIEKRITEKTKVLLIPHLYGQPCDMDSILDLSKKYGLFLIEDCAHACGGEYKGKKVGSFGDVGCFSFSIAKNMTALGGGVVTTSDDKLARKIRDSIKNFDYLERKMLLKTISRPIFVSLISDPKIFSCFTYTLIRFLQFFSFDANEILEEEIKLIKKLPRKYKTRFTNLQASIAIRQLEKLDLMNEKRIKNAKEITNLLRDIKSIKTPKILPEIKHVFHKYVITVDPKKRDSIIKKLFNRGICTTSGFIKNCSGLSIFESFKSKNPVSRKISRSTIYLPLYPQLTEDDIKYTTEQLKNII